MISTSTINILTAILLGIFLVLLLILLRPAWPTILQWIAKLVVSIKTLALERGTQGPTAALLLFRERVERGLSQPQVLGLLGSFSYDDHYIDLKLELRHIEADSITSEYPETLLRSYPRLVILGPPGSGKTTMLHHIELQAVRIGIPGISEFPVFIPVAQLAQKNVPLEEIVMQTVRDRHNVFLNRDQWKELLEKGLLTILIDGLEEVGPGTESFNTVIDQIQTLSQKYPSNPIFMTCRTPAWNKQIPEFQEAFISSLDDENIRKFIYKRMPDATMNVEKLFESLNDSKFLSDLAKSPLFLSLIVVLFASNAKLPKTKLGVYQECVNYMLYKWDTARGVERPLDVPVRLKEQFLKKLGLYFQEKQISYITRKDLENQVDEWFPRKFHLPPKRIISDIEVAHGLLVMIGNERYAFSHFIFQQYFAASELAQTRSFQGRLPQDLLDPLWREVILLLSSMGHTDELVELIMKNSEDQKTNNDYYAKLILAAECIQVSQVANTNLRRKLINELENAYSNSDAHVANDIAIALARTGRQDAKKYLQEMLSSSQLHFHRTAAALGLVELGVQDSTVINLFIENLRDQEAETRINAATALGKLHDLQMLDPLLSAYLQEDSVQVRIEMLKSISFIAQNNKLMNDLPLLALTKKFLREASQDLDHTISSIATEILDRLNSSTKREVRENG